MIFNFNFNENIEAYKLEVKTGNNIQTQILRAPTDIVRLQFEQLLNEVAHLQNPIKIKISKEETIYCQYDNSQKVIENSIQFANKSYMLAFAEEFKEE